MKSVRVEEETGLLSEANTETAVDEKGRYLGCSSVGRIGMRLVLVMVAVSCVTMLSAKYLGGSSQVETMNTQIELNKEVTSDIEYHYEKHFCNKLQRECKRIALGELCANGVAEGSKRCNFLAYSCMKISTLCPRPSTTSDDDNITDTDMYLSAEEIQHSEDYLTWD